MHNPFRPNASPVELDDVTDTLVALTSDMLNLFSTEVDR